MKKRKEEAVVHRKRSSRIALKESEKEQELLIAKRRSEEDERMSRARRAEARQQKEEAERIMRETAREQRRKEREAKQAEANTRYEYSALIYVISIHLASIDAPIDVVSQEYSSSTIPTGQGETIPTLSALVPANGTSTSTSGSRTPAEDWELDCEICGRCGINQVRLSLISYSRALHIAFHFRTMASPLCAVVDVQSGSIYCAMTDMMPLRVTRNVTGMLRTSSAKDVICQDPRVLRSTATTFRHQLI